MGRSFFLKKKKKTERNVKPPPATVPRAAEPPAVTGGAGLTWRERAACQWEVTYMVPPPQPTQQPSSCTYQFSVRPWRAAPLRVLFFLFGCVKAERTEVL